MAMRKQMPEAALSLFDQSTFNLNGLEIFRTGTWHGDVFDISHLDAMVEAFDKVGFKPPVKLGHSENQKLLKNSGLPAAGWIENLYRQDDRLLADVSYIPKQIHDLIQNKSYDAISIEMYLNYDDTTNKKKWPMALKAVALLGSEIPEVTNLKSISSLFMDSEGREFKVIEFDNEIKEFIVQKRGDKWVLVSPSTGKVLGTHDSKEKAEAQERAIKSSQNRNMEEEELSMEDKKELEKKIEDQQKHFTKEKEKQDAEFKKIKEQNESLVKKFEEKEKEYEKEKVARFSESVKTKVDTWVRGKKITPAQGPLIQAIYEKIPASEVVVMYSKDGKPEERKMSSADAIEQFVAAQPSFIGEEKTKEGIASDDVEAKVKAYCRENSLDYLKSDDYKTALRAVAKEV